MGDINPNTGIPTDFISGDVALGAHRVESHNLLPPGLLASCDYIDGLKPWSMNGEVGAIANAEVLCSYATTDGGYTFPIPATTRLMLYSSSVEDDPMTVAPAPGTGVHTVGIYYLDALGAEQYKTVDLNGQAEVEAFRAVDDVTKINKVIATVAGTGGVAAGLIELRNVGGAQVYEQIPIGRNQSLTARYWVPAGKIAFITGVTCRAETGTDGYIEFRVHRTNSYGLVLREPAIYCSIPDKWDEIMRELKPAYYAAGGAAGFAQVDVISGATGDGVCTATMHVTVVTAPTNIKAYR